MLEYFGDLFENEGIFGTLYDCKWLIRNISIFFIDDHTFLRGKVEGGGECEDN